MTKALSLKEKSDSVRDLLERFKPQMAMALPRHVNPDRMLRLALTACGRNRELLECTQASLVGAIMLAAQMGLEPDGIAAALVPYRNKGVLEAQLLPMYRGLLRLAWNSNQIAGVQVGVVREQDHFVYRKGLDAKLDHRPYEGTEDDGAMTHAYAVITTTGGGAVWEVMSRREIDRVKASSRAASSKFSPWATHPAEMWKKTVLRRALKLAPVSIEMQAAITADEHAEAGIPQDLPVLDLGPAKETEAAE